MHPKRNCLPRPQEIPNIMDPVLIPPILSNFGSKGHHVGHFRGPGITTPNPDTIMVST